MNKYLAPKIDELFDQLDLDLENANFDHAGIVLARLSKYYAHFDDELADYYQYATELVDTFHKENPYDDEFGYDDDGQPDEFQEWYDFDPYC